MQCSPSLTGSVSAPPASCGQSAPSRAMQHIPETIPRVSEKAGEASFLSKVLEGLSARDDGEEDARNEASSNAMPAQAAPGHAPPGDFLTDIDPFLGFGGQKGKSGVTEPQTANAIPSMNCMQELAH